MFTKILRGYFGLLRAVAGFVLLLAVSVASGALIVWPLWRLADTNPSLYTVLFGFLFAAVVVFFVGGRVKQSFLRDPRAFFLSAARKAVVAAGIAVPVCLVLAHARVAALIALVVAFALYGFLAFGLSPRGRGKSSAR